MVKSASAIATKKPHYVILSRRRRILLIRDGNMKKIKTQGRFLCHDDRGTVPVS